MIRYYQFTPEIALSVNASSDRYIKYFDSEYWFAIRKKKIPVAIELRIVDTITNHGDDPLIVFRSLKFKNLFWFEYQINFHTSPIQISVKRHFIEYFYFKAFGPFIQTNILEPVLYYLAVFKKQYLLHAATVSQDGKAVCIVGRGGAGKTKTALTMCGEEAYAFMGDDLAFIDTPTLTVHWFPRPLHLFGYNLFKIPYPTGLRNRFRFWRLYLIIKLKDIVRESLRFLTRQKILISTRIDIRMLYPQLQMEKEAQLDRIVTLKLSQDNLVAEVQKASDLRADLLAMLKKLPKDFQEKFLEKELIVLKRILGQ